MALRIAAIGYGDIAQRRHFPQLAELAGTAELVAVAGRDPARLADCAARFAVPHVFTDAAVMLAEVEIDAVLVLTPPDSHADYAEMAVRSGKHVLAEKPLVMSLAEAERLAAAVRAQQAVRPITFFPLPNVHTAEHALVDRLIRGGAVGEVTGVEAHRGHRGPTHAGWFYNRALSGGGVLVDLGIYGLTSIASLFGPAERMASLCTRRFPERLLDDGSTIRPDVEDSAMIGLTLASGAAVSVVATWNGCHSHHATRARVVVTGREGMLHFGVADGSVHVFRPDGDYTAVPNGAEPSAFDGLDGRRFPRAAQGLPPSIVRDFVERIAAGDTSTRSLDIQLHVLEIIARAYAADGAAADAPLVSRF